MSADEQGHPYIATYWRDSNSQVPQYRLVWNDGKTWHQSQVSARRTPFSLSGGGTKMIPIARPRLVINDGKAFYVFRDEEQGSKVSMAYTTDLYSGKWNMIDLTGFPVYAWEPSYDTELWKDRQIFQLFVQCTRQGDGERTEEMEPQTVYVLETDLSINTK